MAIVGQLVVLMGVNNAPLMAGLASSEAQLKGFSGRSSAIFGALKTAAIGVGVATVAGAVIGIKAAADFEDAFAGVRKTVDEADLAAAGLSFEGLAQQFRDMATVIPVAVEDLAAIGETAGALGIRATDIETFTRTVALLGATTDLTTDAAATALGKIGTILGLTGADFENFSDILVNLGNQGASTESEIIEITKRFAGSGKMAGLATEEILALASSVASLGINEEAGGSALSRIFTNMGTEIANNSKKGQALSRVVAGVFDDLEKADVAGGGSHLLGEFDKQADATQKRLLGLVDDRNGLPILLEFLQGLNALGASDQLKALKDVGIRNVNDRNAIIVMAQNLPFVNEQLAIAQDSTGALGEEAAKRFDTFNSKLTLLGNNFNELFITIGTPLLPIAAGFVQSVTGAIQSVSAWIAAGADLGSTFGPIVSGIISKVQELVPVFLGIGEVVMDFATRVWEGGLNRVIGTAADVLGSVVDTIGGLAAAILENQDAMNILKKVADGIGTGFGLASDAVGTLLDYLGDLGDTIRSNETLMQTLADIGNGIAGAFQNAQPAILAIVGDLEKLVTLAGEAADWLTKLAGGEPPAPTQTGPGGAVGPLGPQGTPKGQPGSELLWPIGPKNTPKLDIGPFKNVLGGDSSTFPTLTPTGFTLPQTGSIPPPAPATPIHLHHTTINQIDSREIGRSVETTLYNDATGFSSGFAGGELR